MNATDSIFRRALSKMLVEIFDGPPGSEAYLLNPGDPGLLRQLDAIDAAAASARPMPGKTTIASHVDHLKYGLTMMNRRRVKLLDRRALCMGAPDSPRPICPTHSTTCAPAAAGAGTATSSQATNAKPRALRPLARQRRLASPHQR